MKTFLRFSVLPLALCPAIAFAQLILPALDTVSQTQVLTAEARAVLALDQELETLVRARPKAGAEIGSAAVPIPPPTAEAFVQHAANLKKFQDDHRGKSQALEAKRQEALTLLTAKQLGDDSQAVRRSQLVQDVRSDPAIPAAKRLEVAATAENQGVLQRRTPASSRDELLADFEQAARRLIAEFPDVPSAYEALFRIGRDSTESGTVRIMNDLLAMNAPEYVKAAATSYLARRALVGRSVADLLAAAGLPEETGKSFAGDGTSGVLVYTWNSGSAASLALARRIGARVAPGTTVIGVNLDTNIGKAQAAAAAEGLPGTQWYDPKGAQSDLSRALLLTEVPQVYRVSDKGALTSVNALAEFPASTPKPTAP